jgi:predicted phage terminase large subunit-like protein
MEFPELKRKIMQWQEDWDPDCTLVENRGAGTMLLQELRKSGISVTPSQVKGTEDKITRLNAVADLWHSGLVWYIPTQANERTVLQLNDFPATEHDDLTDCMSQAMKYLRKGGSIRLPMDYKIVENDNWQYPREGYYN